MIDGDMLHLGMDGAGINAGEKMNIPTTVGELADPADYMNTRRESYDQDAQSEPPFGIISSVFV